MYHPSLPVPTCWQVGGLSGALRKTVFEMEFFDWAENNFVQLIVVTKSDAHKNVVQLRLICRPPYGCKYFVFFCLYYCLIVVQLKGVDVKILTNRLPLLEIRLR
jgi:hypothetical protein